MNNKIFDVVYIILTESRLESRASSEVVKKSGHLSDRIRFISGTHFQ